MLRSWLHQLATRGISEARLCRCCWRSAWTEDSPGPVLGTWTGALPFARTGLGNTNWRWTTSEPAA